MNNQISDMESAAQGMANDLLINPHSVEIAFVQHILLLIHKKEIKEISFKDFIAFLSVCSVTTKIAIEKSEVKPTNLH